MGCIFLLTQNSLPVIKCLVYFGLSTFIYLFIHLFIYFPLVVFSQNSLSSSEQCEVTVSQLEYITVVLSLVEHVSAASEPLQVKLAFNLEPSIFSNLLKAVLTLHSQHTAAQGDPAVNSSCDSLTARFVILVRVYVVESCCFIYSKHVIYIEQLVESSLYSIYLYL